jgi:hypothetical protein
MGHVVLDIDVFGMNSSDSKKARCSRRLAGSSGTAMGAVPG